MIYRPVQNEINDRASPKVFLFSLLSVEASDLVSGAHPFTSSGNEEPEIQEHPYGKDHGPFHDTSILQQ